MLGIHPGLALDFDIRIVPGPYLGFVVLLFTNDSVGISSKAKTPVSTILKDRRLGWLGHRAWCPKNCIIQQLVFATGVSTPGHVQPIGCPCSTWIYCAI